MSLGVKECKPATKKHIRRNIEAEFSELLDSARAFLITASLTPELIARSIVRIVMSGEENRERCSIAVYHYIMTNYHL